MFEKAARGLAGQGWRTASEPHHTGTTCRYLTEDGRRCAWGHVDPEHLGLDITEGTVRSLASRKIGIATSLSSADLDFAARMQRAHDFAAQHNKDLRARFVQFATDNGLTWPEGL